MKIREVSDLHLEMSNYNLPEMADDKETTLILAGDIGLLTKRYTYELFLEMMSDRFKQVIWVYGNHEYYRGNWPYSHTDGLDACKDMPNVTHGYQFTKVIDDVAFVCNTLWTDYNNKSFTTMFNAQNQMNDHRLIRTGPAIEPWRKKFLPEDALLHHVKAVDYIKNNVTYFKNEGKKVVVVTHHAPSFLSINEKYKGDDLNGAYATELFDLVMDLQPTYWFHGHTHDSVQYNIGETLVICNPKGYHNENKNFDPTLVVEI